MNALIVRRVKVRSYEAGLYFRDGELNGLLPEGTHWFFDPLSKVKVDVVSKRDPWLVHEKLDMLVKSGLIADQTIVLDLKDHERALVWIDERFSHVLPAGLYAYWTTHRKVRVEVVDARTVRLEHKELAVISRSQLAERVLEVLTVEPHHAGVLFVDGKLEQVLAPGRYAFWKNVAQVRLTVLDLRETVFDIAGQDLMTADKVTLRLNAVVTSRITDPKLAVSVVDDAKQALYREVQLALRGVVGTRDLDLLLAEKDRVAAELAVLVQPRAAAFGVELLAVGIRDVILPGDMKELFNKVTEAKKAAEANLIARREETAAMRSQANTARLLQENPTLMRLRELEVLEKVAGSSKLNVVLGDKGLADRVVHLL